MGDLSEYFSRWEFACRCGCGFDTVDHELIIVLEDLRNHFGARVDISGPNRCPKSNAETDGASENSMHMTGKAVDGMVRGVHADTVADYLEQKYRDRYGVGRYRNRTHIDVRTQKARWDKR